MMRRFLTVAVLAVAVLAGLHGVGEAAARPTEAPRLSLYGDDIWTTGDRAGCRGVIHVSLKTDPGRPGRVFATYTPGRFTGSGPAWRARPSCSMRVWANWGFQLPGHNWSPTITSGPRGGKAVTKTLYTGRGLQAMGFGTGAHPHKSVAVYLVVP